MGCDVVALSSAMWPLMPRAQQTIWQVRQTLEALKRHRTRGTSVRPVGRQLQRIAVFAHAAGLDLEAAL